MELKEIEDQITNHRKMYSEGNPVISDAEFDGLIGQVRSIDPDSPVLKEVGAPVFGEKVQHSQNMGSLDVVNNEFDWKKWCGERYNSNELVLAQPKLDGLTIVLTYEDGILKHGVTRGDGKEGEMIPFIRQMTGVPTRLFEKASIEVRGEGVITRDDSEKEGAANPRNLAVGITKRKNGKGMELVHFVPFQLLNGNSRQNEFEDLARMTELGFPEVVDFELCSVDDAYKTFQEYEAGRSRYRYDMDGAVFKYNNKQLQEQLGQTDYSPKWAVAWKYTSDKAETTVTGITFKTGRTGRVVPVLQVGAVKLAGATCVNVTANNFGFIRDNKIGIGTKLILERAGDVIPHVYEVIESMGEFPIPVKCPSCETELVWEGPNLVCNSNDCGDKELALIQTWIWGMGIEWFGPAAQKALVDEGLLNSIPDIYNITEDEYKRVVGSAMGSKIYLSIQARKVAEWSKVLGSLGVKHLGDKVSRELAKRWKSIDEIIEKLESTSIVGMGTIKKRIVEELERRKHEIYFLVSKVNIVEVEEKPKGTKGSFCVTGTLSKPRKEIHKLIEAEGGNVTASVSKGLDYLVAGEKAGSKLEKAKKLGIKVLSEQELISMME